MTFKVFKPEDKKRRPNNKQEDRLLRHLSLSEKRKQRQLRSLIEAEIKHGVLTADFDVKAGNWC
jgi:hypothetical protein